MNQCTGSGTASVESTPPSFVAAAAGQIDVDASIDAWSISSDSRVLSGTNCSADANNRSGEAANDYNNVNPAQTPAEVSLVQDDHVVEELTPDLACSLSPFCIARSGLRRPRSARAGRAILGWRRCQDRVLANDT